jgi:hypothetical protein
VIWRMNELLILLFLIVIYCMAGESGYRLGLWRRARDESDKSHIGALQGALLGLLALLIGFSFSMAVSRYDIRKSLVLKEANAIGTTYLRTDFLPAEQRLEARRLLRAYVDSRLEFVNARIDDSVVARVYATGADLQSKVWTIASAAANQNPQSEAAGLLISSLNEMIDTGEARRGAIDNHVPEAVLALLIVVSCGALGFIGYGSGLANRRRLPSTITYIILSTLVLVIIMDLDRPRRGLIQVSQASMLRLQESLNADRP